MNLLIDARRPLLAGILDYDAMSGPGNSSMKQAASAYRDTVAGPHGWVVGSFVCPSSRLEELVSLLTGSMVPGERPWQVGVVVDEELGAAAMHASVFHTYMDPAGAITSIETMTDGGLEGAATSLVTAASGIATSTIAYADLGAECVDKDIAALTELAKLRIQPIGGLLDLGHRSPDPQRLAATILASAQRRIPVKVRSSLALDALLLQSLTATVLAHQGASIDQLEELLATEPAGGITASGVGLRYQNDLFGAPDIRGARSTIRSWSCPDLNSAISQLVALGLL
ncbi:MAG: hypothetical protein GY788_19415 [bacterium]|nr:hypothetical protein [bacterium]